MLDEKDLASAPRTDADLEKIQADARRHLSVLLAYATQEKLHTGNRPQVEDIIGTMGAGNFKDGVVGIQMRDGRRINVPWREAGLSPADVATVKIASLSRIALENPKFQEGMREEIDTFLQVIGNGTPLTTYH